MGIFIFVSMAKGSDNDNDNLNTGYIKIFRSLKSHWLWSDAKKMQWWLDILLTCNYTSQKVLIKGTLIECERGQSIRSLDTWAKDWLTSKKTVQSFFKLLQSDGMILVENLKVTTRITICKYESYNNSVNGNDHAKETKGKRKVNATSPQTIQGNKDKEGKETIGENEKNEKTGEISFSERLRLNELAEPDKTNFPNRNTRDPTLQEVKEYFFKQGKTEAQADKFFLHNEGLGWMKGTTKIVNWRAIANLWIDNPVSQKIEAEAKQSNLPPAIPTYTMRADRKKQKNGEN